MQLIPSSNSQSPAARFDHKMWVVGDKLVLFGGRSLTEQFGDLWEYSIGANMWKLITVTNSTDIQLSKTKDPAVVLVPKNNSEYELYIYGGMNWFTREGVN